MDDYVGESEVEFPIPLGCGSETSAFQGVTREDPPRRLRAVSISRSQWRLPETYRSTAALRRTGEI
jgi:hypothetical protein